MFMHIHLCETGYSFTVADVHPLYHSQVPHCVKQGIYSFTFIHVHLCKIWYSFTAIDVHLLYHTQVPQVTLYKTVFFCPVTDVHLLYHNWCLNLCTQEPDEDWIKFPRSDFMKNFKKKKLDPGKYPPPDQCILEMVNTQLKVILWCDSIFFILTIHILFNGCVYTFFCYLNIQKQVTASAKKKINALKA